MLRSLSINALAFATGKIAQFLTIAILASLLGPSDFGRYVFIVTIVAFLAVPAQAGIPTFITREVARHSPDKEGYEIGSLVSTSAVLSLLVIMATLVVAAAVQAFSSNTQSSAENALWFAVYLSVPALVVQGITSGFLRGLNAVTLAALPREAIYSIALLFLVWAIEPALASTALLAFTLATFVSLLAALIFLWRTWDRTASAPFPERWSPIGMLKASIPFSGIAILYLVTQRVDILLLANFVDKADLGVYAIAVQIAIMAGVPLQIFNGIAAPRLASLRNDRDDRKLSRVYGGGSLALMVASSVGIVVFAGLGKWMISAVFGSEFKAAYVPCLILLAGQWTNLSFGTSGVALSMFGHERTALVGLVYAALVIVTLNLVLVPFYGIFGSALAYLVSSFVLNGFMVWKLYKVTGVLPGPLAFFQRAKA